jgi:hypothetical protein
VAAKGVGALSLVPGNLYLFSVTARDADRKVLAKYGKKLVYVPWQHRPSKPPLFEVFPHQDGLPISDRNYATKTVAGPNSAAESFRERLQRFLEDNPNAFEVEYVRVVLAWLWRHEGRDDHALTLARELLVQLPEGCVPADTAYWLLQRIEKAQPPLRNLVFQAGR